MAIRIVQLGSPRAADEGTRIGTVRRPPRGVPKEQFAAQNWYDVWYPNLAPSPETVKQAQAAATPQEWKAFARKYRAERARGNAPAPQRATADAPRAPDRPFSSGANPNASTPANRCTRRACRPYARSGTCTSSIPSRTVRTSCASNCSHATKHCYQRASK